MDVSHKWFKLKGYLEAQKALMKRFSDQNRMLLPLIKDHDWIRLQDQLKELGDISCRIEAIEAKRYQCQLELEQEEQDSIGILLEEHREEICLQVKELREQIQLIARRIHIENRSLDCYVESHNQTIKDIMGELIPESKGALYSPNGKLLDNRVGTQSLLVNKSL